MRHIWGVTVGSLFCLLAYCAPVLAACEIDADCQPGEMCQDGDCVCKPACTDKECGPDGCGGVCGNGQVGSMGCPPGKPNCNSMSFICEGDCTPECTGKECGSDGCGGSCGLCPCDTCDPGAVDCKGDTCTVPSTCDCVCIFDCFEECPAGDQGCLQDCVAAATIDGQLRYTNLNNCLLEAGYYDCPDDDEACLDVAADQCSDQYYECFAGDDECLDMYVCIISCPSGADGEACVQGCFDSGSQEALTTWSTFIDCLDDNGYYECPADDAPCKGTASAACEAEFLACAHGEYECDEVIICMQGCTTGDDLCSATCRAHGTVAAQKSLQALYNCIDDECADSTEDDCEQFALGEGCKDELASCMGDTCLPQCKGKVCGDDGCGDSCGECEGDTSCQQGQCVDGALVADGSEDVISQPTSDTPGNSFNPIIEDDTAPKKDGGCSQTGNSSTPLSLLLVLFGLLAYLRGAARRSPIAR
jgi:hypothetical protein